MNIETVLGWTLEEIAFAKAYFKEQLIDIKKEIKLRKLSSPSHPTSL